MKIQKMKSRLQVFRKQAICMVLSSVIVLGAAGTVMAAPIYKDVPSTHWAYAFISRMADRGLIVGDMEGNFKPNDSIDKFETAKILAKMAGYKYTNVSESELEYYNKAYEKNKNFLNQYTSSFSKWNSSADREIAYLLEKEILTTEDLNQFVIKRSDSTEALRALSREEVAVFLVRFMGRKSEALNLEISDRFQDDASISIAAKPYVYYIRSLGIASGDDKNNFNPNGAVTKAVMAVMCDRALSIVEEYSNSGGVTPGGGDSYVNKAETISGTIDKYYDSLQALQIISGEGKKNIYKLSPSASISIDGFLKTAGDLREGMTALMVINNNELVDIKAQSIQTFDITVVPVTNTELSTIEGTVSELSGSDSVTQTISIEIRMINPKGQVTSEIRPYALTGDCTITRGQAPISLSSIQRGDIVSARVSGNKVYSIQVEEKDRELMGATLLDKNRVDATNSIIYTIQDKNGSVYDFRVTSDTYITRKGLGTCAWNELRKGDTVDVYCEYDTILEIYASGVKSSLDVWVQEIHTGSDYSFIVAKDMDNYIDSYDLISGTVDAYSLRVGSKVRLRLDSKEVETVTILQDATTNTLTGYIQNVRDSYIVIRDSSSGSKNIDVRYDDNTVFVDSYTGNRVYARNLNTDTKVYVVFSGSGTYYAKTVTVLSR